MNRRISVALAVVTALCLPAAGLAGNGNQSNGKPLQPDAAAAAMSAGGAYGPMTIRPVTLAEVRAAAALPGAAAKWHCFYDREREAQQVVFLVKETKGSKAILIRNRAHLDEIVPALKKAGVRFRAVDIEQLGEKQVVQDLSALTRALLHLGDRIAWLAVLRAPWCGLTLADLLALSSGPPDKGGSEFTSGGLLFRKPTPRSPAAHTPP